MKSESEVDKKMKELDFLKSNISSLLDDIDELPNPPSDLFPGLNLERQAHDYNADIELIKEETKETLDCISNLYLNDEIMKEKNISNIIRNDAEIISDIKFSISCSKRGLISCMRQLDVGTNDPEMHVAVGSYQKEIRDSNKMIYELLTKMKIFYKGLKDELKQNDINISGMIDNSKPILTQKQPDGLIMFDPKMIDDILEQKSKNPTFL